MQSINLQDIKLKSATGFLSEATIQRIETDSRSIGMDKHTLFICLKGPNHNAHNFIPQLVKMGVRYFIVSEDIKNIYPSTEFIRVENTLEALQEIASWYRMQFKIPVVAITGSNGKTIVKEWVSQLLSERFIVTKSPKSFNSQVGVPLSVLKLTQASQIGVFEAGISKTGEMELLHRIINPDIGLITVLTGAHQENFSSLEEKLDEKLKLFEGVRKIIYRRDHKVIHEKLNHPHWKEVEKISWGEHPESTIGVEIKLKGLESIIKLYFPNEPEVNLSVPFIDKMLVEDAIHAFVLAYYCGGSLSDLTQSISELSPVQMRMELLKGIGKSTVISDCYNADLDSLEIALDFLNQQQVYGKRILILSDFEQSGMDPIDWVKKLNALLVRKGIQYLYGIGDNLSSYNHLLTVQGKYFKNTSEFKQHLSGIVWNNDAILVKGARKFALENVVTRLEEKVHRTVLEVNLDFMAENLGQFRSLLRPETKIMAMVKALGYGSGGVEIAQMLQNRGVNYLAVAFADEGISLRRDGITLPILVLNSDSQSYHQLIADSLEPEIFNLEGLKSFNQMLQHQQLSDYPIHIKLDTGMFRQGFTDIQVPELLDFLAAEIHNFRVVSLFSHLSASEAPEHDEFTKSQAAKFLQLSEKISNVLKYQPQLHLLNSAGIERFPEYQFDMVRLGIGLYGINATNKVKLEQVSKLKSYISMVKWVPSGETIGYGRKGKSPTGKRIGIVPIGYADGVDRKLSNGVGGVWIHGNLAPFIGNICMDMCMIDITDIQAEENDDVVIWGPEYSVSKLADKLDTIPYELFTRVSSRVKRVYLKN